MMKKILVGIDGSARGARALHWAARRASRGGANLELLSVIDSRKVKEAGASIEDVQEAVEANLDKARNFVAKRYPNVQVEMRIAEGEVVENIVDASVGCDLIVLGSHHGISVGDTIGGAKPLRVAVSAAVPTAVIPADWAEDYDGEGVVVGIDPDGSTNQALDFSIAEAIATEQPLRLIMGWGLPAWISKPAEAMGGGLGPVGEQYQDRLDSLAAVLREEYEGLDVRGHAVEGSSPTRVLQGYAKTRGVLVLGTRSRAALGRALFGSVTHSTLLNLTIPTVIVPQD